MLVGGALLTGQAVTQRFTRIAVGDGTSVDPSIAPTRNKFDGWYFPSTGVAIWTANGSPSVALSSGVLVGGGYCFAPTANAALAQTNNTADAGFQRIQAGVVGVIGCDLTSGAALKIGDPGTRPTCDVTLRGTLWIDEGSSSVQDSVAVCAKDASDNYGWRTIY
jgi:hypothetical protein